MWSVICNWTLIDSYVLVLVLLFSLLFLYFSLFIANDVRVLKIKLLNSQAQPDVVYIQTQHPLIGLINTIGFKISNTADFFAGMLRGTIQVIKAKKRKLSLSFRNVSAHPLKRKLKFNGNFRNSFH